MGQPPSEISYPKQLRFVFHYYTFFFAPRRTCACSFLVFLHQKTAALRPGTPAAHPPNAYCCFRQDLTGFTPEDRTGPNLHRTHGKRKYIVFSREMQ